ncbi:MAG: hypothetical protein Q9190_000663 [Brigantiaea leucoxantha]
MRIESNYAKAEQFIEKAASDGAQLAVLPEYHLTNWVPEDPEFGELCGQWEIYLQKYQALAKKLHICIVPGTIVERHRSYVTEDKEILINVAYFIGNNVNPRSEALFLDAVLTARAFENTCAVIFVNAGGAVGSSKNNYAGLSRVVVPFRGPLGEETKNSAEEGMSIVDLDMRLVEEAEINYKVREDMRKESWHYSYRHVPKQTAEKL